MSWETVERAAHKGPGCFLLVVGLLALGLSCLFGIFFWVISLFSEAAQVGQEEFGPRALLVKYELFKDQAAALDSKRATIEVTEQALAELRTQQTSWTRADREEYYLRVSELRGLKASYNSLAAEYNASMSKFNYRFANVGELPEGASQPLPREFKPYLEK